jgi:predicted DNA-binding protein (UPF0251 family)
MFKSFENAISYYLRCNPVRLAYANTIEPESYRKKEQYDPLDIRHPHRKHAEVTKSIQKAEKSVTDSEFKIFRLHTLEKKHYTDVMEECSVSKDKLYRTLAKIRKIITKDLISKGLLEYEYLQNSTGKKV